MVYFTDIMLVFLEECRLLGCGNVPSSLILSTVMMEAIHSSESSVLTRFTLHQIPENLRVFSLNV
jgi:hypothetical protein